MKPNQKTVYLMCPAMKALESFWLMPQLKDFGCHWEKKSK